MTDLPTIVAQAVTARVVEEYAYQLVVANRDARGDDALDALHAAAQCYARLVDERRTGYINDGRDELAQFLAEPVDQWLSNDGDVRFYMADILESRDERGLAAMWEQHIDMGLM